MDTPIETASQATTHYNGSELHLDNPVPTKTEAWQAEFKPLEPYLTNIPPLPNIFARKKKN